MDQVNAMRNALEVLSMFYLRMGEVTSFRARASDCLLVIRNEGKQGFDIEWLTERLQDAANDIRNQYDL